MTDGPFRNSKLSSRWKRYGEQLVSDAASPEERIAHACHSMLGDVGMAVFSPLLKALKEHTQRPQMDLDPITAMGAVFDSHAMPSLAHDLQKNLFANLRDQVSPAKALDRALHSAVTDLIGTTKNRLDEHCILARDLRDMSKEDYDKGIDRNRDTFAAISPDTICDALTSGNKRAFKQALEKKKGVDEGPDE